mmetsp:Transcript_36738/g.72292  ORF Transcript_36738/g.72292 Transcript_36738/m.72292 type:complete len:109 (-) Transcript_36738:79-405(-)
MLGKFQRPLRDAEGVQTPLHQGIPLGAPNTLSLSQHLGETFVFPFGNEEAEASQKQELTRSRNAEDTAKTRSNSRWLPSSSNSGVRTINNTRGIDTTDALIGQDKSIS